ncbi:hypothetical protein I6F35_02830 [Bradyrhizobium sp. BRP22]|uniref:hypothetical protein n=1 Tax=Bradyrhizobium sp. BRP22 TaxID=2793821 RepID=UPI001CD54906|nr:hypothetical protein [Bradyrhizobium sp. BRP22]MCA1452149.1 hypothetical protein [Bradyrhizobium sp. BRP22]
MALAVLNGPVIQQGESLSDGLDCTSGTIVRFTMPAEWTPANLTFQISSDGNGYNDLVDVSGKAITLVVVPGSAVVIASLTEYLKAVAFLKLRSGTREYPVAQAARREFAVAVDTTNT